MITAPLTSLKPQTTEQATDSDGLETTIEEIEGYHIVRAILAKVLAPSRVVMRDTKSYSGILLDDNNQKPICRLRFNFSQKYVGLFDAAKNETRHPIERLTDIFKLSDQLMENIKSYDSAGTATSEAETGEIN